MNIPVCEPTIGERERSYVEECMRTGWISSSGKFIERFERKFAEFCGTQYAISCSNGTTALHLAVLAAGIEPGDQVICPDFSIIATSNAILYANATPIFCDVEPVTGNIDPDKIEHLITPRTKAIMVVHMYGCPVKMEKIYSLAEKYNLKIIEDAAEAHGAKYRDRPVGSLGHVAAFSFYANKIISCGEGGMVTTNDKEIADKVKLLRNHAFKEPRFVHDEIGYNYRMTNIQAAIGLAQLERAEELIMKRKILAEIYGAHLCTTPGITIQPRCNYGERVCWMYDIRIDEKQFGMSRDDLMLNLQNNGIETRTFFHPLSCQLANVKKFNGCTFYANSQKLWKEGMYLPSSSHLKSEDIIRVCDTIKSIRGNL